MTTQEQLVEGSPTIAKHRKVWRWALGAVALWAVVSVVYACSAYMEATRPEPTDISQFTIGTPREDVLTRLGQPVVSTTENGNSCDVYHLYTQAIGAMGRAPIAIAETAADVFTVGLAEVVLTPAEMVTRNAKYPVKFCYRDNKLLSVTESSTPTAAQN